jgi:hypothetical protein
MQREPLLASGIATVDPVAKIGNQPLQFLSRRHRFPFLLFGEKGAIFVLSTATGGQQCRRPHDRMAVLDQPVRPPRTTLIAFGRPTAILVLITARRMHEDIDVVHIDHIRTIQTVPDVGTGRPAGRRRGI